MSNFETDTLKLIPGETPREKFETLQKMVKILQDIAWPGRGSAESAMNFTDFVEKIDRTLPGLGPNVYDPG